MMNKLGKFMLLVVMLLGFNQYINAQVKVSGIVKDASEAIIGATIFDPGSGNGVVTDSRGRYSIELDVNTPFQLTYSYIGYAPQTIEFDPTNGQTIWNDVNVILQDSSFNLNVIVVGASRFEERVLEAPVTIRKLSSKELQASGQLSAYEAIGNIMGVWSMGSSVALPSYNTRGFSDPGNFRFKQQIDGIDLTNPIGLAIAGTMGASDLDISSVEVIPGASSALYGSDAFNGVLRMYTKSPFDFPEFSMQTKVGVTVQDAAGTNPLYEQDFRIVHLFNNKLAFKADISYRSIYDWIADDQSALIPARQFDNRDAFLAQDINDPNGYLRIDAVHRLGDEYANGIGSIGFPVTLTAPDGTVTSLGAGELARSGITEKDMFTTADFFSNRMESFRGNFSLHYRFDEDWELSYMYKHSFSDWLIRSSVTFPQYDYLQRMHHVNLKGKNLNFRVYQHKLDNFRGSFSGTNAADAIQQSIRPNDLWVADFQQRYTETGSLRDARIFADRFMPGGSEFNKDDFEAALAATSNNTDFSGLNSDVTIGSQTIDFSSYINADLDYDFSSVLPFQLLAGLNYRRFNIDSEGTFYNDGALGFGEPIVVNQVGMYVQSTNYLLDDKLRLTLALRFDDSQDYESNFSPRVALVYNLDAQKKHFVRGSFQTGFRIPSIQEGFFRLQLTSAFTNIGSAQRSIDNFVYQGRSGNQFTLQQIIEEDGRGFTAVQPEKNTLYEVGYKGLLANDRLLIDLNGYFTQYQDLIIRPVMAFRPGTPDFQLFAIRQNRSERVQSYGVGLNIDYKLAQNVRVGLTYNWNDFDSNDFEATNPNIDDDQEKEAFLRELQFNTPEHRLGIFVNVNKFGPQDRFSFNAAWKYSSSFHYFSNFGENTIPTVNTTDMSFSVAIPELKSTVKIGGSNIFQQEYTYIYGGPLTGAIYYVSVLYQQ
ncbi:MAG: TonB-dependent receptor [Bacteroidota bacterium]